MPESSKTSFGGQYLRITSIFEFGGETLEM